MRLSYNATEFDSEQIIRYVNDLVSKIPTRAISIYSALPTASSIYRGKMAIVLGATGARDTTFICLKADDDSYSWVALLDGGA